MQFIVGVLLFTCVVGWVDSRIPWPTTNNSEALR